MNTSPDLNWLIIRNSNSYLLKKRDIPKPFSKERNNLTNLSTFRYSGLVHKKTLGVIPSVDKKGFTVVYKKSKYQNKPVKNTVKVTFKHGARRSLGKMKRLLKHQTYRSDLRKAALRRASAIIRSQRILKSKKPKAAAPKKTE